MIWNEFKIKEIINHFQNGYAFNASNYTDVGIPIISMQSISLDGKFQLSEKNNCWDEKEKERLTNFILKKGDLIMSMTDVTPQRNLIGCSTIIDREGTFFLNQRVGKLEADESKLNIYFLDYYFKSNYWRNYCRRISSLSVQANIGTRDILNGKIKLPPKPEQTAIATLLSKVDEAIAATQNSIKAASTLKKALMQNLLTGKLKPDGSWRTEDEFYDDEKFGKVPKGWEVDRFKNRIKVQYGKSQKDIVSENGTIPIYGTGGIIEYGTASLCEDESILIGRKGTIDKPYYIDVPFWAVDTTYYVESFENGNMKFLFYSLQRLNLKSLNEATGVPSLTRRTLNRQLMLFPTLTEQNEITAQIAKYDNIIESKQTKIQTLQRLKKSLMQNLLTGKVRLPQEFIAQFEEAVEAL